ncbi:hypothetical protein BC343_11975 [Mucilaginibacter pedocola]|uniref:Uncharacterized protein n=2 Tax=Mucilaginibacter pedocola TaxID=1792845 RepID=A0A1S9P977_9SPHI|nr:hypothetical protein BC343_11975 [Mucilaginibacter pedocola]
MDINVLNNGNHISYGASYLTDPLNDLLSAAVLFVSYQNAPRMCFCATHELEPSTITWLLKWQGNEMVLLIWEDVETELQDLIDAGLDEEYYKHNIDKDLPDITKGLLLAVKDSPRKFIQALIKVFPTLQRLKRDSEDADWGFTYSKDKLATLEDWLASTRD